MAKGARRGRPIGSGKPAGEKYILRTFRFPPGLWQEFSELVPDKERSAMLRQYMEKEIKKRMAKVG
jgi:hypothetical protein